MEEKEEEEKVTYQTIWKEEIGIGDENRLLLPKNARILSCQIQRETPYIWFMCDPKQERELRIIRAIGTGHNDILPTESLGFIDTIQMLGGSLIYHVFEDLSDKKKENERTE